MYEPRHRKPGLVGSFTVHSPDDYRPKHRGEEEASPPVFDWMECFD